MRLSIFNDSSDKFEYSSYIVYDVGMKYHLIFLEDRG